MMLQRAVLIPGMSISIAFILFFTVFTHKITKNTKIGRCFYFRKVNTFKFIQDDEQTSSQVKYVFARNTTFRG